MVAGLCTAVLQWKGTNISKVVLYMRVFEGSLVEEFEALGMCGLFG